MERAGLFAGKRLRQAIGEVVGREVRRITGVRRIRLGYNPNSSSLGINASLLLYGTLLLTVLAPPVAVGAWLFLGRRRRATDRPEAAPGKPETPA